MIIKCSFSIFVLTVLFLVQLQLGKGLKKPPVEISKEESSVTLNENFAQIFNFGHGRLLAAITWVVTLIEGDIEHYNKKDGNSWMFHRFKSISIFDPYFYENYLYGGQYLSIIKDDISGASYIYDKGLKKYSKDFWLNYHAGFHFYFEAKDLDRALQSYKTLESIEEAVKRFPNLPTILAKLRMEKNDPDLAFQGLKVAYDNLPPNSFLRKKFHTTLYSIKAKTDLKCLNDKRSDCEKLDFDGKPYVIKKGSFVSQKSLSPILINRK
ncbi:MAG: hypothetical protein CME70_06940 [Halobacteriovorax sp.]|nr:hypothetical protein [Halobacteriovorax sp.]|tara:strand:- start:459823 stop:460623 length:801 start_codon:yes stop_codon:yes gene_type:complete